MYLIKVIKLPYGDQAPDSDWKLVNDWQVYEASPYEYTIKLEADMYMYHHQLIIGGTC